MKTSLLMVSFLSVLAACSSAETRSLHIKVEPERDRVLRSSAGDVIFQVEIRGRTEKPRQRLPLNLAVVLDRSGSMSGAKLEQAKQAALTVLDQLAPTDYFSLLAYDDEVQVLVPARRVENKERVRSAILALRAGDSTALYAGVREAAEQVKRYLSREKINRVILLSDGLANVGPSKPSDLASLGGRLLEERIHVTTIGLGDDYNEDLMMALSEASGANYYYVRDAEKLPGIFREELGNLQSIVARNIRIILEMPEGVRPVEVMGHPEVVFKNNRAELVLQEHYAAQQRGFLIRCEVLKPQGKSQELARVTLRYQDEVAGCRARIHAGPTDGR
ncbi:MAG: VWA domain-containing protein, partial [Blastochloris sp.]|nr:VWA domain-containing protein [Blastochloris sp.]